MKIGLLVSFSANTAGPADLARFMESVGFESIWAPEHPAFPVEIKSPWPGGGPVPAYYGQTVDPFVALAMAAAATTRLKLGTGVCLVVEHNPIVLAKETATLDAFSGGRFILGIGAGWLREEAELLGVDFAHRWAQTAEFVAAIRELWRKPEASFDGKYVKFPPLRSYPRPAQPSGPPVHIGSVGRNVLSRVARWADGWCPIRATPEFVAGRMPSLREECRAVGRDPGAIEITVMNAIASERARARDELARFAEAGVHRFVARHDGDLSRAGYQRELERLAALVL